MLNGKFKCTCEAEFTMRINNVYDFKNGYYIREDGEKSCQYASLEEFNSRNLTQIEPYVEEKKTLIDVIMEHIGVKEGQEFAFYDGSGSITYMFKNNKLLFNNGYRYQQSNMTLSDLCYYADKCEITIIEEPTEKDIAIKEARELLELARKKLEEAESM